VRPRSGDSGRITIGIVGGRSDEAFEEGVKNHVLRLAAGELRIERGGLGAVAGKQNSSAGGFFDTRGSMRADVMKPRDAADEKNEEESTNKPAHEADMTRRRGNATGVVGNGVVKNSAIQHSITPACTQNGPMLCACEAEWGFQELRCRRYYLPKPKLKLTPLRGRL
jgi:hypothetical protein